MDPKKAEACPLRKWRMRRNLSQRDVGFLTRTSQRYVSAVECGHVMPTEKLFERVLTMTKGEVTYKMMLAWHYDIKSDDVAKAESEKI